MNHAAAANAVIGAGMGIMMLFTLWTIAFGLFITWIISLIDILKNEFEGENTKIIWIAVLMFTGPLGPILYQTVGKKQKKGQGKAPFAGFVVNGKKW